MKKVAAVVIAAVIIISSVIVTVVIIPDQPPDENGNSQNGVIPPEVYEIMTSEGVAWVGYDASQPGTPAEAHVTVSDTTGLTIVADFHGFWRSNTTLDNTTYDTITIPDTGSKIVEGRPEVPRLTRFVEVPHGVDISYEVTYDVSEIVEGYNVLPFQTPGIGIPNATSPEFKIDTSIYSTNTSYPDYDMKLDGEIATSPIILRGRRLLEISIYPVRFNPVSGQLKVYSVIQARLTYDSPAQIEPVNASLWSEPFEKIFEGFLLNYKDWGKPNEGTSTGTTSFVTASYPEDGAEYLIITVEEFREEVEKLAAWKTRKGTFTKVVTMEYIMSLGMDIGEFVSEAYYSWAPVPSYVLLFGDSDLVPCSYGIVHTATYTFNSQEWLAHGPNGNIATDLLYFTVEGDDYLPEIIHGRISVDSGSTQHETIVNKILSYEKYPPMDIADEIFYSDFLAASFFDGTLIEADTGDYYRENQPYVSTSERVRKYLDLLPYNSHTAYYSGVVIDERTTLDDGSIVDQSLAWDADYADVRDSINEGRFLVFHVDHGDSKSMHWYAHPDISYGFIEGWGAPGFRAEHVAELTNGDHLPLVININCNNGWFDSEIDQEIDGDLDMPFEECLAEYLTRKSGGGAIAAISSTRISWNDPAEILLYGITNAFWPGYGITDADWPLRFDNQPIYDMGSALLFGKLCVEERWHDEIEEEIINRKYAESTFQSYHLFGDPETPLWTSMPSYLRVSYPFSIGTEESQGFVVTVKDDDSGEPVHYAKVCLQKESEVYEVGYTNVLGQVMFNVQPTSVGPMNITVTKQNYKPEIQEIDVVDSPATLSVSPDRSEAGLDIFLSLTNFDNEIVDVYFETTQVNPQIIAVAGSFNDVRPIPITEVGPVFIRAVGQDSQKTAVVLFTLLSDDLGPEPYIYSQWDDSTWHLADPERLVWNNPCIQLYKEDGTPAQSNNLEVLQRYRIEACIHNSDLQTPADQTVVTFTWSHFGAGQRTRNLIGVDEITIAAGGDASEIAEVYWTPTKTGHSCIRVSVFHPRDENVENNIGQENTDVLPVQSPGEVDFNIQNPICRDSHYYIEVRQLGNSSEDLSIWETKINGISPYALPMGYNTTVALFVNAPSGTSIDESRTIIVNVYFDGLLVGGISTLVVKEDTPIPPPPDSALTAIIIGTVGITIGVIVVILLKRKRGVVPG